VDLVFFRGDDAHGRGDLGGAMDYYRETVSMAPAQNRAGLARMRWGQAHLTRGEYQEAAAVYEGYLEAFPNGRRWQEAAYWAARSHSSTGDAERADELLSTILNGSPLSYYAVLAAEQRGEAYVPRLSSAVTATGVSADTASWIREGLRELDLAREAGMVRGASAMSRALRFRSDATDEELLIVGEELNRRGLTVDGINVGWELSRRGRAWDERLLKIVYPYPYRAQLEAVAEERGLDPYLLAGLIRQESAFWTTARSRANALGLMQVVPATGRALARALGPPGLTEAMLFIPEVNIHLGTAFLSDLMDRFTDGLPVVLSGYNAGPTRATRWRQMPEVADLQRFTERIPFEETRGYVKSVVHFRALYAWLYQEGS
jgi:soluble lytic murein transglycosylase